jgi:FG-GAP repeat
MGAKLSKGRNGWTSVLGVSLVVGLLVALASATGPARGRTTYVLGSPHAQAQGGFGWALAVGGSFLVVGASGEDISSAYSAGNAYVFDPSTGLLTRQLPNPNPEALGGYGWSVVVSGNEIVVGSPSNSPNGVVAAGNVTVFNATSGKVVTKLVSPNFPAIGAFGFWVAADAACIVIAAAAEGAGNVVSAGHAYIH